MEIPIDETYWIRSDERNFIIARKRTTQTGENAGQENWENPKYYTSLPGLAVGVYELGIRGSKANTLAELARDCEASLAVVKRLYGELDQYKDLLLAGGDNREYLSKADGDSGDA